MKIGVGHNILHRDLPAAFEQAAAVGADGVEVVIGDELARKLGRDGFAEELRGLSQRFALEIPSLALNVLCAQPSLIVRAELAEWAVQTVARGLRTAAAVGASALLLPFFGRNMIETDDEINFAGDALADLAEAAEQVGVVLGVESTLNVHQQLLLLGATGHSPYVRIYFDTGNALARKYDAASAIRDLGQGAICQVHFKDVRVVEGNPPDFDVALGQGSVDFRAVAHALRAVRYDGYVVLETPGGTDPAATTGANIRFARELLAAPEST